MFFFKIVCVISFFMKTAVKIPVFILAYFNNLAVQ